VNPRIDTTGRTPWTPSREPVASAVPSVRAGPGPAPAPWVAHAYAPPAACRLGGTHASWALARSSPRGLSTDLLRGRGGGISNGASHVWRRAWSPGLWRGRGGGISNGSSLVWRRGSSSDSSSWPRGGRPSGRHGPRVTQGRRSVTPWRCVFTVTQVHRWTIEIGPSFSFEEGSSPGSWPPALECRSSGGTCCTFSFVESFPMFSGRKSSAPAHGGLGRGRVSVFGMCREQCCKFFASILKV
jgi:hypothetical protein